MKFIKLHRINLRTSQPVPNGEILVNADRLITVENEGEFGRITLDGEMGYIYVQEDMRSIERLVRSSLLREGSKMTADDIIREEETYYDRQDEVCKCSICGNPIFPEEDAVGLLDGDYPIIVCKDCADAEVSLGEWLSVLQIDFMDRDAESVHGWIYNILSRRESSRKMRVV